MAVIGQHLSASKVLQGERRAVGVVRLVITVIFFTIFAINLGAFLASSSSLPRTHLMAALIALYLLVEARAYLRRSDFFGLLSPAFLALIFHFFLSYLLGITVSVFSPWVMLRYQIWLPELDNALSRILILTGLSAFCMLRGYSLGRLLALLLRRSLSATSLLRQEMRVIFGRVLAIQGAYFLLVAYAIQIGVYGLLSTVENRKQFIDIVQLLNLALAAGTLSYFLILLRFFERREAGFGSSLGGLLIFFLIATHVIAGALSGFKSQIVFPFVIAGVSYFIATQRLPLRFIAYACAGLVASYVVIEPFRSYLGVRGAPPTSITAAVEAIGTAFVQREQLAGYSDISRTEAIASRFDIAGMSALAIAYVDSGALPADKRDHFQDSILLAPILAYVPRVFWPNKPSYSEGVWFNQNVRGSWNDETTSVGMGPIGYLYMAGGVVGVLLGFIGFGILQALIFEGFARAGAGGMLVYLSVAAVLVTIPTSFGPSITGVLRTIPLAFIAQMLLLRAPPRRGSYSR